MTLRELEQILKGGECNIYSHATGYIHTNVVNIKYLSKELLDAKVLRIDLGSNIIQVDLQPTEK